MQQWVQIMSFDRRALQGVPRIAPEIPTVDLTSQQNWGDNVAAAMGRLIDLGIDGLITDRLDGAQRVLKERQIVPQ